MKRLLILVATLSGCVDPYPQQPGQMPPPPPLIIQPMNPADYTIARTQAPLTTGMKVCPNGMIVQQYYLC